MNLRITFFFPSVRRLHFAHFFSLAFVVRKMYVIDALITSVSFITLLDRSNDNLSVVKKLSNLAAHNNIIKIKGNIIGKMP